MCRTTVRRVLRVLRVRPGASGGAPLELIAASLRRERRRTGLSLTEVARRAGIAKSTLSQLESGTGNPSLETLWAICVALDAPFSRLLDPPRPQVLLIRADEGPTVSAAHANYQATLLAACPPGARRDVYRIAAEPGHPRESQAAHGRRGRARGAQRGPGADRRGRRAGGARAGGLHLLPGRPVRTCSRRSHRGPSLCWSPSTPEGPLRVGFHDHEQKLAISARNCSRSWN